MKKLGPPSHTFFGTPFIFQLPTSLRKHRRHFADCSPLIRIFHKSANTNSLRKHMAVKQIGESVAPVFSSAFLSFLPQLQMTPSSFPSLTKRNCCNWRHTHTKHREELKMQQISPTGFFIVVQIIQIFDTANNTNIENANNH